MMSKGITRPITGFGVVLLFLLAFAILIYRSFHTVIVKGVSMYPTFKDGQKVYVSSAYWLVGPIKVKDVVVLSDSNADGYIIKRVYRTGGQTVDEVNAPRSWKLAQGQYVVPDGCVYVLGDNRAQSEDSRAFGPEALTKILGKVVIRNKGVIP
jgi:signal peptidase I